MNDSYKTISAPSEGCYTEKRSRFIAYAVPVISVEDIKKHLDIYRRQYYDARHICWAYMLGADRSVYRVNDDGEPSSTAGKPILGQINSNELTDILIVVVRYFGGIELGVSRLTAAYRTAAAAAIAAADIEERTVNRHITVNFEYPCLNGVMRIIKNMQPAIISQTLDMNCEMTLCIRNSMADELRERLSAVDGVVIRE